MRQPSATGVQTPEPWPPVESNDHELTRPDCGSQPMICSPDDSLTPPCCTVYFLSRKLLPGSQRTVVCTVVSLTLVSHWPTSHSKSCNLCVVRRQLDVRLPHAGQQPFAVGQYVDRGISAGGRRAVVLGQHPGDAVLDGRAGIASSIDWMAISIVAPGCSLKNAAYASSMALRPFRSRPWSSARVPFSVHNAATALASPRLNALTKAPSCAADGRVGRLVVGGFFSSGGRDGGSAWLRMQCLLLGGFRINGEHQSRRPDKETTGGDSICIVRDTCGP